MKNKEYIIIGLILIIILVGFRTDIRPKLEVIQVAKSIEDIPVEIEKLEVVLSGVDKKEYPTQGQMLRKGKKAISPFLHNEDCSTYCRSNHEDRYQFITNFNRLDKQLRMTGKTYGFPYYLSLYNQKDEEYNLYYEMVIRLDLDISKLKKVQKAIDNVEKAWGVKVKQEIKMIGIIKDKLDEETKAQYANKILKKIGAHTPEQNCEIVDKYNEIYYGYVSPSKEYKVNEYSLPYNIAIRFTLDSKTGQTKMSLEFPT